MLGTIARVVAVILCLPVVALVGMAGGLLVMGMGVLIVLFNLLAWALKGVNVETLWVRTKE